MPAPPTRRLALAAAVAICLAPLAAHGLGPEEILADPALEARARAITGELRCVVCQSESIDDSNAEIARDLRLLVRERLTQGDTDAEVIAFVTDRYGEFVLLRPPMTARNAPLWLAGPAFLAFGAALVAAFLRRRAREARRPPVALTAEERERLDALMRE